MVHSLNHIWNIWSIPEGSTAFLVSIPQSWHSLCQAVNVIENFLTLPGPEKTQTGRPINNRVKGNWRFRQRPEWRRPEYGRLEVSLVHVTLATHLFN